MSLFKRQPKTPAPRGGVAGLPELARARGWTAVDGVPFGPGLVDQIWHATWTVYDRRERLSPGAGNDPMASVPNFHDAYRGEVDGRRIVVANHQTNLATVTLYDWEAAAVCAVELGTLFPVLLIKGHGRPYHGLMKFVPVGSAAFDERFDVVMAPVIEPGAVLTAEVQQRIMSHDDWAFLGDDDWLVCVRRAPFETADDVSALLDEVLGVVHALPASMVPTTIDRSVDDLAARIEKINTLEDGLAFLEPFSDDDRKRLAASDTPLAPFADVRTPDEAMARLQSLDVPQRMKLLGMFERLDER